MDCASLPTTPLAMCQQEKKQLPQNLRCKGLRPRAITTTAWLCSSAAILPQTLQVLLRVRAVISAAIRVTESPLLWREWP